MTSFAESFRDQIEQIASEMTFEETLLADATLTALEEYELDPDEYVGLTVEGHDLYEAD